MCCVACAVSWASWLLFTGVPARCVVLRVRCPGPLGSCSPVCPLGVLCYMCGVLGHLALVLRCARWVCCSVCGVLGHLALVHRCACLVCCVTCAVSWATWLLFSGAPAGCVVGCAESWATWLLFTGAPARCVALCVRCPGPLGFLFTDVPAPWVVLRVQCPGPLGSCSPVCPLRVLCCACGVLGHLHPVHRCARSVRCVVCAVSWATWLLFTCAPARCVASRVQRPGPLGSCSPVCPLRVLFCVCGVLGLVAPVQRCVAPCVVLRVRCPGLLGSRSPVRPLRPLLCSCGVLGHLTPVHRCARSVCCFACAVSWTTWLLFTGVLARCVVLRMRCPGPLGSFSSVRPLNRLCCVYGVLGRLALVHRCARSVCCASGCACGVAWAGRRCGALTRPSGRRLFVAGRGWVPSRRALVHPDGGCS